MANVGKMEEEARKRKERLKSLKSSKGNSEEPPSKKVAQDFEDSLPKPVFRSYKPLDETLKENQVDAPKPVDVTEHIQSQLEAAQPQTLVEEVDLVNLAPRKPDWDLKRDVTKKLEKLERRTQRAIAELIRERLQTQGGDLATAASAEVDTEAAEED